LRRERTLEFLAAARQARATVAARLARRTSGASDADRMIAGALAANADPWPEAKAIVTDATPDPAAARALADIGAREDEKATAQAATST
jgi:predicted kinase